MKYLFFFKGQPLLLCCVCCKIAIQDFLTGLHKKNKKNLRFHRRVYRRNITRRYFTESCKNIYGIVPHSPTSFRRLFRRPILTDSPSESPTDLRTSLSSRMSDTCRLHQYRRIFRHPIPTASPMDHACLTRVRLHQYRWIFRRPISTASPTDHACLTRVPLHQYRRIEKFGGIFEHFWCGFQLISDGI